VNGRLWVADTENHLLRALDFNTRTVTTVAGIGEQCMWQESGGRGADRRPQLALGPR
jgi:hypothetical protein